MMQLQKEKTTGYMAYYTSLVGTGGRLRGQTMCGVLQPVYMQSCAIILRFLWVITWSCNQNQTKTNVDYYVWWEKKKVGCLGPTEKFLERIGDSWPLICLNPTQSHVTVLNLSVYNESTGDSKIGTSTWKCWECRELKGLPSWPKTFQGSDYLEVK